MSVQEDPIYIFQALPTGQNKLICKRNIVTTTIRWGLLNPNKRRSKMEIGNEIEIFITSTKYNTC